MTALDLLTAQIDEAGYQLGKAFDGFTDEWLDAKPIASMMSAREQAEHLCECYVAAAKLVDGVKHDWGTYAAPDRAWDALRQEMLILRDHATRKVLAGSAEAFGQGAEFLVAHDCYHVGQLSAIRIAVDPAWDPYSIYRG